MIPRRAFSRSMSLVLALSPFATPLQAARLQNVTGNVVVNTGQGFEPARNNTEVVAGDQIVIGPGARAVLQYSAGCSVPVPMETVVTVSSQAPCVASKAGQPITTQANSPQPGTPGETVATNGATEATQAAGETVPAGQPGPTGEPGATGEPGGEGAGAGGTGDETFGISNTTLAIGAGVAAAIGVGIAVAANANKKPASP